MVVVLQPALIDVKVRIDKFKININLNLVSHEK